MLSRPTVTLTAVSLATLALAACDPRLPASRDAPDPNSRAEAPPLRVDVTDRPEEVDAPPPSPTDAPPDLTQATNPEPPRSQPPLEPTPVVDVRPAPEPEVGNPEPVQEAEPNAPRFTPASVSHCRAEEQMLYNCPFTDGRVLSVCVGDDIAYRFGELDDPELELIRDPAAQGVHYGVNRRRGEGRQSQVRFENGAYDYVVYSSQAGHRGRERGDGDSGVVVLRGGEVVHRLECPVAAPETAMRIALIRDDVSRERRDGRYDTWW